MAKKEAAVKEKPAKAKAEPKEKVSRAKPWEDLKEGKLQKRPRTDSVADVVLKTIDSHKNGATLEQIQEKLDAATSKGKHPAGRLIRWMNAEQGIGFAMDDKKRVSYAASKMPDEKAAE